MRIERRQPELRQRADYKSRAVSSFSKPETTQNLKAMIADFPIFENGKQREAYRRSVERVWRAVTRHAREEKRRYRRRQLSDDAYHKVEADFVQARKSYEEAINLYRHHIWNQSTKPAKPSN